MCLCPELCLSYAPRCRDPPAAPRARRVRGRLTHSPLRPRAALLACSYSPSHPISSLAPVSCVVCLYRASSSDTAAPTSPRLRRSASAGCKLTLRRPFLRDSRPTGSNDARSFLLARSLASRNFTRVLKDQPPRGRDAVLSFDSLEPDRSELVFPRDWNFCPCRGWSTCLSVSLIIFVNTRDETERLIVSN